MLDYLSKNDFVLNHSENWLQEQYQKYQTIEVKTNQTNNQTKISVWWDWEQLNNKPNNSPRAIEHLKAKNE